MEEKNNILLDNNKLLEQNNNLLIEKLDNQKDVRYEYVVDQQPIGKLLFDQWCEFKGPAYHRCLKFLDAAKRYEVETDEQRLELANIIKKEFLHGQEGQEGISLPVVSVASFC
ncbi:hypothetical protein JTB14_024699 [Gonioctena quinquepunctata]|nr:hypothetical protein JTB14_024699 [Gonioctena quinquepunctata]